MLMGSIARLLLVMACLAAPGCETMESVGDTIVELIPEASEPASDQPLWEETIAPASGASAAVCRTNSTSCPLDPPLPGGTQCTCAAEGAVSIGIAEAVGEE
jgi:hypothetical protein